jgi:hypothetical protein
MYLCYFNLKLQEIAYNIRSKMFFSYVIPIVMISDILLLSLSLRVGYGSSFVFRCTLDTDKFDISINVFSLNLVMFQLY